MWHWIYGGSGSRCRAALWRPRHRGRPRWTRRLVAVSGDRRAACFEKDR
jgi:hypothetical protein